MKNARAVMEENRVLRDVLRAIIAAYRDGESVNELIEKADKILRGKRY